jgi:hypothetical protein
MGLDITWHSKLTKAVGNEAFDNHGELRYDDGWFQPWVNPEFPGRADELESKAGYRSEEFGSFRAGSYSGYNRWRDDLATLAGWLNAESAWKAVDGPFWELITFSDCEGVIGAAVSAKLAKDFAEHQQKADVHPDEWFREKYADWRNAFVKASDDGCVDFH